MLSPAGITVHEAIRDGLLSHRTSMSGTVNYLIDYCGFDIRYFSVDGRGPEDGRNKVVSAYRIVGRSRWDGGYRSFV